MTDKNCGTCTHAYELPSPPAAPTAKAEKKARTVCRRYPPQTHFIVVLRGNPLMGKPPVPVEEQRSAFPVVLTDWYCAEWAPRIEVAA